VAASAPDSLMAVCSVVKRREEKRVKLVAERVFELERRTFYMNLFKRQLKIYWIIGSVGGANIDHKSLFIPSCDF